MQWRMLAPARPRGHLDGRRRLGAVGLARRARRCATRWPPCLGRNRLRTVELTTNYRTSTEVAALAARLLARIDPDAVAAGRGAQHRRRAAAASRATCSPRCRRRRASCSARSAARSASSPRTASSSGCATSCPTHPRLSVVDPWQVKGLEYDGCVVADPHGIVAEGAHPVAGLRSLYVALTRATQRLVVVSDEPLAWLAAPA